MADKNTYIQRLMDASTKLAQVSNDFEDLVSAFFDRGYNSGGVNEILDGDISTGLGISASDVSSAITLAQQLANFLNNAAISTGDYDVTLNKLRTDI